MGQIKTVRIYGASQEQGIRILADRLWPRGISREQAHIDLWWRDIAPSPELRKWYGHDGDRFPEFAARYTDELSKSAFAHRCREQVRELLKEGDVLLLFAAKDTRNNNAVVLKQWLEQ
ncbi:MAG: DUF488 family protein [Oscillospiraceae bacterium]|nr:DUF488 family protein [Oscillospiraceae bacterium]